MNGTLLAQSEEKNREWTSMIKQNMALFLAGLSLGISGNAFADCPVEGNIISKAVNSMKDYVNDVGGKLNDGYDNGKTALIVSGYAYHWRSQYTPEKLKNLNEKALGVGVAKEWVDESGNRNQLAAAAFFDSHRSPEFNATYNWEKPFHLTKDLAVGGGFIMGLTSRRDIAKGAPVPLFLPELGIHHGKNSIQCTVIPHLSKNMNSGAVTYCYGSHQF